MKKNSLLLLLLFIQLLVYGRDKGQSSFGEQALSFRENRGQIRDQQGKLRNDIDFVLQASGMTLYIGKGQLHYQFIKEEKPDTKTYTKENPPKHYQVAPNTTISRLDVLLQGANDEATLLKEDPHVSKYHYYTDGSEHGITGVSAYGRITYKNIYPNIDWVLYTQDKQLKYDFVVHPGGRVADIQMSYSGAQSVELLPNGSLKVNGPLGSITEEAPYIYEQASKKEISSKYVLRNNTVHYETGDFKGTLVIDPGVHWATYFGGEEVEEFSGVAAHADGHIYISGSTNSLVNMATTGAHQTSFSGAASDAFLAQFDSLGQLQWATYYGGTASSGFFILTMGTAVTTNAFGQVYLTGITSAETGIATPGSFQPTWAQHAFFQSFLVRFNSEGIRQWGTYYGASIANMAFFENSTMFYAIACDQQGNVYIGGQTDSLSSTTGTLVTTGAHQTTFGGVTDALLVKFDSSGNRLWATYYGGSDLDNLSAIACDESNNVYISGGTASPDDITTPGTLEDNYNSEVQGYLVKFNSDGERQWGTYLRGGWVASSLATDTFNHVYVGSSAQSGAPDPLIFTPGCHQNTLAVGMWNAFLIQFDAQAGTRNWGTYYGAENNSNGLSVACDGLGNVFLAGSTNSYAALTTETIATFGSYQDTLGSPPGISVPPDDAFLVKFDSTGKRKWATYYGGPEIENGRIACGPNGALYLAGGTSSATGIATPNGHQTALNGDGDVYLVRFLPIDIAITSVLSPEEDTVCSGDVPLELTIKNQGRVNKTDDLVISYSYTGPDNGSAEISFPGGLDINEEDNFNLGNLSLPFPGDYQLTVYLHYTGDDHDRDNDTIHVNLTATNAEPVAAIDVNQIGTVFHFSNPSAQPSDSYLWDFGDGETSAEPNPSHEYAVTATYEVTLMMTGFCGSDTATAMVDGIGSSIAESSVSAGISLYPNPARQALHVKTGPDIRPEDFTITNILGQKVLQGNLQKRNSIYTGGLVPGTYFIRIQTDKGWVNKQFQVLDR